MGLIKAIVGSTTTAFGDQFKEFVNCPTISKDVLIQRGVVTHGEGNKNHSSGIITNGSTIVVPQGMAMMLIENGEIKEFTADAGTFYYDTSSEPSIFTGILGKGIIDTFKTIGKRFTFGGQTAKDQRVYYVNLLVNAGNKFGSPQAKKITDEKYGMLEVTFFGEYSFRVIDPILLVNNVIGANPLDTIFFEDIIGSQLHSKLIEQITQAISIVMRKNKVSFGDIGMYGGDISNELNACLDETWKKLYGLLITDVALNDINLTDESMKKVNKIDEATIFSNKNLQSGLMASASADAMRSAASNESGSMMGFMGMNMAGATAGSVMAAANAKSDAEGYKKETNQPEVGQVFKKEPNDDNVEVSEVPENKRCSNCNEIIFGNFCSNCGEKVEK